MDTSELSVFVYPNLLSAIATHIILATSKFNSSIAIAALCIEMSKRSFTQFHKDLEESSYVKDMTDELEHCRSQEQTFKKKKLIDRELSFSDQSSIHTCTYLTNHTVYSSFATWIYTILYPKHILSVKLYHKRTKKRSTALV